MGLLYPEIEESEIETPKSHTQSDISNEINKVDLKSSDIKATGFEKMVG